MYVRWYYSIQLFPFIGYVNTVLSWKGFIPLSRLTYCAYLVHPPIIYYYLLTRRRLIHFTDTEIVSGAKTVSGQFALSSTLYFCGFSLLNFYCTICTYRRLFQKHPRTSCAILIWSYRLASNGFAKNAAEDEFLDILWCQTGHLFFLWKTLKLQDTCLHFFFF